MKMMNNTDVKFLFGIKALDDLYGGLTSKDVVMILHTDIKIKSVITSNLQTATTVFYRNSPQNDQEEEKMLELFRGYWDAAQEGKRNSPVIYFLDGQGYTTAIVDFATLLIWFDRELEKNAEGKRRFEVTVISQKEPPSKLIVEI